MSNKNKNDSSSVFFERKILESLNQILEFYSDLEKVMEAQVYQEDISKRFLKNTGNNVLKSSLGSSVSLLASCGVFDFEPSVAQSVVAIVTGSVVGFTLFQKANRREFLDRSLDTNKLFADVKVAVDNFYVSLDNFNNSVTNYVNNSDFSLDDFIQDDHIKHIFDNNSKYIEERKSSCDYDGDFGYEKVFNMFNNCFQIENGVSEYLNESKERELEANVLVKKR